MCRLHFMWISSIGPKKCDSIKNWFNICNTV
ncbi:CLUMA_CG006201, isoform A [Clunio marinus]|uniref:CLUMA_CG006201, isoform A n=1 Tax=Clunio marinus TaxID=568069 RepID=A0A1J1HZA7_9DIPT|nr:CLUMA_CG006201, isoform A [Clunio marinus]